MKTLTLYISDDTPGPTIEQKTHATIAAGFDEAGFGYADFDEPGEPDSAANLDMVCKLYRVASVTKMTGENSEGEWEVVIEGEDDDIAEYEKVLKDLE